MQRRMNSQMHSSVEAQGCHKATLSSIPTRFQRKDPKRPRFDPSLVTQALEGKGRARSLRQVASALLQKDSKRGARQGKEQEQKRLLSVQEEEGRLAEGHLPQIREADPQVGKAEAELDEGDVGPRHIISVETDAGEEEERRIEVMEEGGEIEIFPFWVGRKGEVKPPSGLENIYLYAFKVKELTFPI